MPLQKRISNTFINTNSENIFFLHIPKCGGVSIHQAIKDTYLSLDFRKDRDLFVLNAPTTTDVVRDTDGVNYPYDTDNDFPILKFREQVLLYHMAQPNTRFISGHFVFSGIAYEKYSQEFSFVTTLRDPVKRWISSYFFNRYKSDNHMKIEDEIEDRLETHFGVSQGFQLVKFLGGARSDGDYTSQEAINRAKENLNKFKLIGFLDNLEKFSKDFHDLFKVKIIVEKKNQNPIPNDIQSSILTPEILERITGVCEPDIQVYEFALDEFGQ